MYTIEDFPQLLVGLGEPDDSAVYQINDTQAIITTADFFPPVVDDAYDFGAIAAANALSDIYAMGGTPMMAMNLVAYPDGLGLELLAEILRGGADKALEAGCVIAGGHTVTDKEPKYGLSVVGQVHPDRIVRKSGAQFGDILILTKPLGAGVITTALKNDRASVEHVTNAVNTMKRLNKWASELAVKHNVHAMTDVTGYSLMGHGHEMAHLGHVGFELSLGNIQFLDGAIEYADADIFPGGMHRNENYFQEWIKFDDEISSAYRGLLFDPQTSGGLLIAVSENEAESLMRELLDSGEQASIIGYVTTGDGTIHVSK